MQRPSGLTTVLCSLAFVGATGGAGATGATGTTAAAVMPASLRAGTPDLPQPAASPDTTRPGFTTADVRFMQGMIAHHAQALVMAALVPSHTDRDAMHLLAQRIEISQRDEIALMQHWLADRHQRVPEPEVVREHRDSSAHRMDSTMSTNMNTNMNVNMPGMDMAAGTRMPGMLTAAQLSELASAKGVAFDRLFLQDMIGHHEGALVMVADLLATNGAAQAPEVFQFASDVDADQRAEILRMRALLNSLPDAPRPARHR